MESRQLPELEILSNGSMEIKHIQIPTPAAPRPIPQMGKVIQNPPTYLVELYTCILLLIATTRIREIWITYSAILAAKSLV